MPAQSFVTADALPHMLSRREVRPVKSIMFGHKNLLRCFVSMYDIIVLLHNAALPRCFQMIINIFFIFYDMNRATTKRKEEIVEAQAIQGNTMTKCEYEQNLIFSTGVRVSCFSVRGGFTLAGVCCLSELSPLLYYILLLLKFLSLTCCQFCMCERKKEKI